jgi:hypothetical protein
MPIKPLPYGISNYDMIIREGYAYVDKTMYIRALERAGVYNLFLRPRRFGKSLFTSMLGYYYDINQKDNFDTLFSNMDIGQNPSPKKNAYYILKFDFSGIRTDSPEIMLDSFTKKVHETLLTFCATYHLDITLEMDSPEIELFQLFNRFQRICDGKIYVIIDEYDHFANELLGSNFEAFKGAVTADGFVRKWYEILKEGAGTIVERIFITGVSPITLDSLTSGFSISKNFSMDSEFNEMIEFTTAEVEQLIEETISEKLPADFMNTITEYYNGYCFSKRGKERVFNSTMVLYYLDHYHRHHEPPDTLLDKNALSDYGKLEKLLKFKNPGQNREILQEIILDGYTTTELVDSFSISEEFKKEHFKSLLFYLGLLTVKERGRSRVSLQIPNTAMMGLYFDFLLKIIAFDTNYDPEGDEKDLAVKQIAYEHSCEKLILLATGLLNALSNLDYREFNEKYIKFALIAYSWENDLYKIESEYEIKGGGYIDLVFFPEDSTSGLDIVLFEFKYIKKSDVPNPNSAKAKKVIAAKRAEAMKQLEDYASADNFSGKKLTCFALVFLKDICVDRVQFTRDNS